MRWYLDEYQVSSKVSKVTIDNVRRILSSFFAWLEDEDYISKSPVRRIHKVKTCKTVKETYTDEALELMRDNSENIRDLAMIDILASTGMRVGELVRLNRDHIDFQTCLRKFIRHFPSLFGAFRCPHPCCLALSGTFVSTRCFQLLGWVRDGILYIKRCVLQGWTGDTENTGPAAECAAGPVRGFMQILRGCKQGKRPSEQSSNLERP